MRLTLSITSVTLAFDDQKVKVHKSYSCNAFYKVCLYISAISFGEVLNVSLQELGIIKITFIRSGPLGMPLFVTEFLAFRKEMVGF